MKHQYDIIIVGGGIVGLTLACALAQRTSLSIVILEAKAQPAVWDANDYYHRVSAINLASQRLFQALEVWPELIKHRVSPFTHMYVWDALTQGRIHFDCADIAETQLGHIIENNLLQQLLMTKLKSYPQVTVRHDIALVNFSEDEQGVHLHTDKQQEFHAKLAVAADGAQSWLREQVNIPVAVKNYHQTAIVATVQTAILHEQWAQQVFLETGPLAFLPLSEPFTSSIVWSLPPAIAKTHLELSEAQFNSELTKAFAGRLGDVIEIKKRHAFPLHQQEAARYVQSRVVLVGDAAHMVHPLAGQGLNMGLLDAACLAEIIIDAYLDRRDFCQRSHLRRYERWRKADNQLLQKSIHALSVLFSEQKQTLQQIRSIGLNFTQQSPWLKNLFIQHAVGNRQHLPKLAQ